MNNLKTGSECVPISLGFCTRCFPLRKELRIKCYYLKKINDLSKVNLNTLVLRFTFERNNTSSIIL